MEILCLVIGWIYDHEALVGGILTLVGTIILVGVILWQEWKKSKHQKKVNATRCIVMAAQIDAICNSLNGFTNQYTNDIIRKAKGKPTFDFSYNGIVDIGFIYDAFIYFSEPAEHSLLYDIIRSFHIHSNQLSEFSTLFVTSEPEPDPSDINSLQQSARKLMQLSDDLRSMAQKYKPDGLS